MFCTPSKSVKCKELKYVMPNQGDEEGLGRNQFQTQMLELVDKTFHYKYIQGLT